MAELATRLVSAWGSGRWVPAGSASGLEVEAKTLRLDIDKAVISFGLGTPLGVS